MFTHSQTAQSYDAFSFACVIFSAKCIHCTHPIPSAGTANRLSLQALIHDLPPQMVLQTPCFRHLPATQTSLCSDSTCLQLNTLKTLPHRYASLLTEPNLLMDCSPYRCVQRMQGNLYNALCVQGVQMHAAATLLDVGHISFNPAGTIHQCWQ